MDACRGAKVGQNTSGRISWGNHARAREVLSSAPPYPGYTPPLPAKVDGDGTVDAAFVAANAGEYTCLLAGSSTIYTSDGNGKVTLSTFGQEWAGVDYHSNKPVSRFLPLPPKDNKCESSSGCGAGNMRPSQSSSSFASSSAESPNPSEPVASGERVYHNQQRQQAEAWQAVVNALNFNFPAWLRWEGKNAQESAVIAIEECRLALSQGREREADLRTENARLQSELAGVRGRMEAAEKVCVLADSWRQTVTDMGCTFVTDSTAGMLNSAVDEWLSSRPLAPAEVKK